MEKGGHGELLQARRRVHVRRTYDAGSAIRFFAPSVGRTEKFLNCAPDGRRVSLDWRTEDSESRHSLPHRPGTFPSSTSTRNKQAAGAPKSSLLHVVCCYRERPFTPHPPCISLSFSFSLSLSLSLFTCRPPSRSRMSRRFGAAAAAVLAHCFDPACKSP